jgi:hypothetical protein
MWDWTRIVTTWFISMLAVIKWIPIFVLMAAYSKRDQLFNIVDINIALGLRTPVVGSFTNISKVICCIHLVFLIVLSLLHVWVTSRYKWKCSILFSLVYSSIHISSAISSIQQNVEKYPFRIKAGDFKGPIFCFWTISIVFSLSKTPSCLFFKTRRFGDWIVSPFSDNTYSVGSNRVSVILCIIHLHVLHTFVW